MTDKQYRICDRCVMDTSVPDISFNENMICNYCITLEERSKHVLNIQDTERDLRRKKLINTVKHAGRGKPYDCIVGVSGGVDSSFALVKAVSEGLRPLAVHMDNGWNSELAQNNIENLVKGLGVDLHTHVINWNEYRELMQSFFDSDVVDVELLYDNAMLGVNYSLAKKFNIKYILAGTNYSTEGMLMPAGWNWFKFDKKNILNIAKKFGRVKISSFPIFGVLDYFYCRVVRSIEWISFLDYYSYDKDEAVSTLVSNYSYKPYPYKHYESIFTRFYQGYILPGKFGVDKRRVHLSTLVVNGQMSRAKAMEMLAEIPYPSIKEQREDIEYFLKKMNWTESRLQEYLSRPGVAHETYGTEKPLMKFFQGMRKNILELKSYAKK